MQTRSRRASAGEVPAPSASRTSQKRRRSADDPSPPHPSGSASVPSVLSPSSVDVGTRKSHSSITAVSPSTRLLSLLPTLPEKEKPGPLRVALEKGLRQSARFLKKAAVAVAMAGLLTVLLTKTGEATPYDLSSLEALAVTSLFAYWVVFLLPEAVAMMDVGFLWQLLGIVLRLWAPEVIFRVALRVLNVNRRKGQTTLEYFTFGSTAMRTVAVVVSLVLGLIPFMSRRVRLFFKAREKESFRQ